MTESVLEFGPARRLVGILSRPGAALAETPGLAVVITNSGIIHRVGANRVHVRLARALARAGYPVLRYDLPGIGDSERGGTGAAVQEENIAGTRAALDALQRGGVADRFVMVGLCSGADHAFATIIVDPRVVGAVMIDPTGMFSTRRHRFNRILQTASRGLRPRVWWRLVTGQYNLSRTLTSSEPKPRAPGLPRTLDPQRDADILRQMTAAFKTLADRGERLFVIITRHNREIYSYRRQLFDTLPDLDLEDVVNVEERPSSDHTFSTESDRAWLERRILAWIQKTLER
jgi:pimeloyl-ACP methyl ester carboxylesterase